MKGRKTDLTQSGCAIARSLGLIGDWWSLLIIRDALGGTQRFGEFQKSIGLAKNILSSRLKKLVEGGIFTLEEDRDTPSVRLYVLTERGRQLAVVLLALWQWGEENCFKPGELRYDLTDKMSGRVLAKVELKTNDGSRVDPRDLRISLKLRNEATAARGVRARKVLQSP